MRFNKYVFNIIIRSLLIATTALLMMLFAVKLNWIFTFLFICILFLLQIFLLIKYVSKVNRDIANFLVHLKEQNTSLNISGGKLDSLFGHLTQQFESINTEFKKIEDEKIRKENLLNQILDRVGTGIILIDNKNNIKLHNKAILKLLGIEETISKSDLNSKIQILFNDCNDLETGEQKIVNININNLVRRILVSLSETHEDKEILKIFSFHDIDREMTDYELQSWNGLIKVLSHEIMNTLTPMSTTVDTIKDCLTMDEQEKTPVQITQKDILDAVKGTNLLENRVKGLQNFIKRFRQFLDIPVPEIKPLNLYELVNDIVDSYRNKLKINLAMHDKQTTIPGDKSLVELVLINIIKNSVESNANHLNITSKTLNKQVVLELSDDGNGIDSSTIKKVFLPFYTTKKGGSGIGLSLARQIMYSHNGNIEIHSELNGTLVKLYFKIKID